MIQCMEFHTLNFISVRYLGKNLEIRNCNLEIINIRKMPLHCLKDVMQFLRDNLEIRDLVSEYVKFIRSFNYSYINLVRMKNHFLI